MRAALNADMAERLAILRTQRDKLEAEQAQASKYWNSLAGVGEGRMGLTPDAVKFSLDYQAAKRRYDNATAALRTFNTINRKLLPMLRRPRG